MEEENMEQRFICVWLDNQLMKSEDYVDTQNHLRTLVKFFQSFTNSDACVDFITDITGARIFLITSYALGKNSCSYDSLFRTNQFNLYISFKKII